MRSEVYEKLKPIVSQWTRYGRIDFYCPTGFCAWRASTLLTKEPMTIGWIDSMPVGSVFWDIGANVGCYSLYAAKRGLRVVAFEPAAANYAVLVRNAHINNLPIEAYCLALGSLSGDAQISLSSEEAGHALHSVVNSDGMVCQSTLIFTVDTLTQIYGLPAPDYLKIDVDGIEPAILSGAPETLKGVKSVLVEVNNNASLISKYLDDFIIGQSSGVEMVEGVLSWNAIYSRI